MSFRFPPVAINEKISNAQIAAVKATAASCVGHISKFESNENEFAVKMLSSGFSKSPEWADVVPIPQTDTADDSVARIAYTELYAELASVLRALAASDELSPRALALTESLVRENPAHYTAWSYRRRILFSMMMEKENLIHEETKFASEMGRDSPKNYQIWYHRKCLVDLTKKYQDEVDYTTEILLDEPKNYHAWAHRQYVLKKFFFVVVVPRRARIRRVPHRSRRSKQFRMESAMVLNVDSPRIRSSKRVELRVEKVENRAVERIAARVRSMDRSKTW